MIGFYNRDEKCLLRSMDWVFKNSSLRFVFKRLTNTPVRFISKYLGCNSEALILGRRA